MRDLFLSLNLAANLFTMVIISLAYSMYTHRHTHKITTCTHIHHVYVHMYSSVPAWASAHSCRGGSRTSSRGGHKPNDRAQSAREIFGLAHFCEDHAHIVAANETNSPRCQWNPTFSSYKQVFSYRYILCQIKVHWLKGGWQSWMLSQAQQAGTRYSGLEGGGGSSAPHDPPLLLGRHPCTAFQGATIIG